MELLTKFSVQKIVMRVKTQSILKVKKRKSEEQSGSEDENEENNWVFGAREPTRLNFTADEALNANLPDSPSFSNYFHLLFLDHPFDRLDFRIPHH